jgi:hypothetical protein
MGEKKQKQCDRVGIFFDEALQGRKRELVDNHLDTLESKNGLAVLSLKRGDYYETKPILLAVVIGRCLKLGDTHPHTIESLNNLIGHRRPDTTQMKPKSGERNLYKLKILKSDRMPAKSPLSGTDSIRIRKSAKCECPAGWWSAYPTPWK